VGYTFRLHYGRSYTATLDARTCARTALMCRNLVLDLSDSVRWQPASREADDCSIRAFAVKPRGPLGIILMGLGVAKIDKHAIAQILRDEPAEAAHDVRDAFLVGRDNLAQVFRVHARRECR
jgi:hypothetical protein